MPIVALPDGTELDFPDDMPMERMREETLKFRTEQKRVAKGEDLRTQMKAAVREGELAEAMERGVTRDLELLRPFASTAENPLGAFGSAAKPVGEVINYAGDVGAAAVRDVRLGQTGFPATGAALSGSDIGEAPGGAVGAGLEDAGRMAPLIAGGTALQAAGVAGPVAFGAPMFASTLAETDDTAAAVTSGMTGAVIPGVGQIGREAAAKVMGNVIQRGFMTGTETTAQKFVEAMASQGGIQVFMEGLNVPAYVSMSPEERVNLLTRNLISNTAFAVMDVPGIIRRGPSETQNAFMTPHDYATMRVGEVLAKVVNSPQAMEALRIAADEVAFRATDPNQGEARQWRMKDTRSLYEQQSNPLGAPPELLPPEPPPGSRPFEGKEVPITNYEDMSPEAARGRAAWIEQLHGVGPESPDAGRWTAIENDYIRAKAAQEALPDVPLKDIFGITIKAGPYPNSPVADHFFVPRDEFNKFTTSPQMMAKYPPGQFTQQVQPGYVPHKPRKGEPQYEEWLKGARPAPSAPEPAPAPEPKRAAVDDEAAIEAAAEAQATTPPAPTAPEQQPTPVKPTVQKAREHEASLRLAEDTLAQHQRDLEDGTYANGQKIGKEGKARLQDEIKQLSSITDTLRQQLGHLWAGETPTAWDVQWIHQGKRVFESRHATREAAEKDAAKRGSGVSKMQVVPWFAPDHEQAVYGPKARMENRVEELEGKNYWLDEQTNTYHPPSAAGELPRNMQQALRLDSGRLSTLDDELRFSEDREKLLPQKFPDYPADRYEQMAIERSVRDALEKKAGKGDTILEVKGAKNRGPVAKVNVRRLSDGRAQVRVDLDTSMGGYGGPFMTFPSYEEAAYHGLASLQHKAKSLREANDTASVHKVLDRVLAEIETVGKKMGFDKGRPGAKPEEPAKPVETGVPPPETILSKEQDERIAREAATVDYDNMPPWLDAAFRLKRAKTAFKKAGKWTDLDANGRQKWQRDKAELQDAARAFAKAEAESPTPKPERTLPAILINLLNKMEHGREPSQKDKQYLREISTSDPELYKLWQEKRKAMLTREPDLTPPPPGEPEEPGAASRAADELWIKMLEKQLGEDQKKLADRPDMPADVADRIKARIEKRKADIAAERAKLGTAPEPTAAEAKAVEREDDTPDTQKEHKPFDPAAARGQKKILLAELDKALTDAPTGEREQVPTTGFKTTKEYQAAVQKTTEANRAKFGTVLIDLPGDGTFEVINERGALTEFRERAKKFPVTADKIPMPTLPSTKAKSPGAIGDTSKESVTKAAVMHTSTDEMREILNHIWSDGKRTVSTDGRRMIIIEHGIGGTEKKPLTFDAKGNPKVVTETTEVEKGGKKVKETTVKNYPDWKQVVPREDQFKGEVKNLDTERLTSLLRQAEAMTSEKSNSVLLHFNQDGSFGLSSKSEDGSYEHNVEPNPKQVVAVMPEYLLDALQAARRLGHEKVSIHYTDELAPIMVKAGRDAKVIIMPMRLSAPPEPPRRGAGKLGSPMGRGGGELGGMRAMPEATAPGGALGGPRPPEPPAADNPKFSMFDALPMEMPEAVKMAREFLGNATIKLRERIRALGGRAAGVFIYTQGPDGKGRIELRRDLVRQHFNDAVNDPALVTQAMEYARAEAGPGASDKTVQDIFEERLKHLQAEALEKAKLENPAWAMKVIWHEIGHVVDWLGEKEMGRGNLFGRIASFKNYTDTVLPVDPARPAGERITDADLVKLRKEAERLVREDIGPIQEIIETIFVEEPILRIVGLSTEDVKNLLGMDAREKTPELYRWFAEQSAEVKKEILKKALRGTLDPRLAKMGRTEQVGTKRVKKTIRKVQGREPTQAEILDKFKKLFREELEKRNLAELKQVKAELEPMIAWWRGTEKMEAYFKPSVEMYAEAFSVLMNNPQAVAQRAPTYYRMMFNYMGRKPQVAELYGQIQDHIKAGVVMNDRVQSLYDMWGRDNERSLKRWRERWHPPMKNTLDSVLYHYDRRFGPIYRAAQGYSAEGRLNDAVGNFIYRASEHELVLNRINRDVSRPLVQNNMDWNHLGEYMFHQRIVRDRYALFNPEGWTSKNSHERLEQMRNQLGPERWQVLVNAQKEFRRVYDQEVMPLLREANMFTPETQQLIENSIWYATFAATKDQPTVGIDRLIETSAGKEIGPRIYRQVGNLGEIKQPATATVLKALSLISAAHRNIARRETVKMIQAQDPLNIGEAETRFTGRRMEPVIVENSKVGTIIVMEGGKAKGYYVRKAMAEPLNYSDPIENNLLNGMIAATNWLKAGYTQLNYGFWPVNFVRDTMGFWLNMPGLGAPIGWARNFPAAMKAAKASVKGTPNPHADDYLRRRMAISREDPRGVWSSVDNEFDLKVASFGMDPAAWDSQLGHVNALMKLWHGYKEFGKRLERVNKISGMLYLDQAYPTMPEWKKREIVRERAGSPDFLQRGADSAIVDLVGMFYNPWKEGVRSTVKAASENPYSWTTKMAGMMVMPSLLQAAAAGGLLGEDLKKKYRSIPDYHLTNGYNIPIWWTDEAQGKVMYLHLPLPEPIRIGHGLLFKATTGRGEGYASFLGGQVPGLNSMLGGLAAWIQWGIFGHNPYDFHRGQYILPDKVHAAGGGQAAWELGKWTWNELGGGIFHRFQNTRLENPPQKEVEKFLAAPGINNFLGRWLKVSNRGLDDEDRQLTEPIQKKRAQIRLAVDEVIRKTLEREAFTKSEKVLMREPYAIQYWTRTMPEMAIGRASPILRRLNKAQSQEEKLAILGAEMDRR